MKIPCRVIVDARAAVLHSLYTGKAAGEVVRVPETDKAINPPSYGVQQFIQNHLKPLLELYGTLPLLYVWDADDSKEIRKAMFDDYKKGRDSRTETENRVHNETFDAIKQLLASLGVLQVSSKGMEADDVIGFFAHKFKVPRVIYTRDSDLWQLHNGDDCLVHFFGAKAPEIIDRVIPRHIPLYKALVGDTGDDIPGVKGFGEKAWDKLVDAYGEDGIDELHDIIATANCAELTELANDTGDKALAKIVEQFTLAVKCYQLARIHHEWVDSYVNGKIRALTWFKRVPSMERLKQSLLPVGLSAFLADLEPYMPIEVLVDANNLDSMIDDIVDNIAESYVVPFDYESYDTLKHADFQRAKSAKSESEDEDEGGGGDNGFVDVLSQKITGASFCFGKSLEYVIYMPTAHKDTANLDISVLKDVFDEIATTESKPHLVAHNAGFEWQLTKQNLDIELDYLQDTALWSSYADEKEFKGLKKLSKVYLNYTQTSYNEVLNGHDNMSELTGEEVMSYGCDDSLCTGHLWHLFTTICEVEGTFDFVVDHEFPAMQEFYHGFSKGTRIDLPELRSQQAIDAATMEKSLARMKELLELHCSEEKPEHVEAYLAKIGEEQRAIFQANFEAQKEKGNQPQFDWVEVRMASFKAGLIEASRYVPPQLVKKEVKFIPTEVQFARVCDALELPPIDKASAKGVSEWLDNNPPETDNSSGLTQPAATKGNTFRSLLGKALPELKGRVGTDYEALVAFCSSVLGDAAGMVTVGDDINFSSPPQMQALFYAKLGLPVRLRSKVQFNSTRDRLRLPGSPATDKKAIAMAYANDAPQGSWKRELLENLSKYKKALKREESMWRPYPLWVHPSTGNIHASIKGCGTETRRPTSSNPNLLQVAKGDREPPHPRRVIKTLQDDYVIVDPDFNGQELRILASECRDPSMLDAYLGPVKKDLHTLVTTGLLHYVLPARDEGIYRKMLEMGWLKQGVNPEYAEVDAWRKMSGESLSQERFEERGLLNQYGLPYEELTAIGDAVSLTRDKAGKPTNFLIVYGGGYNTLSQNTAMPVSLTKLIIDETLNRTYTRLKPWTLEMIEFARQHGYVETAYGMRKHVSKDINHADAGRRSRVERQLVNFIIQGCAADMLKVVLAAVARRKLRQRFSGYLMAPVYDELVYHVKRPAVVDFSLELMDCMRVTPPGHEVPMVPELSLGFENWHELVGLGATPTADTITAVTAKYERGMQ